MPRFAVMSPAVPRRACATRARALGVALALCAGLASGFAGAATYKWTDANGHVVYSDQPPPGNVKSEMIGPAAPPSNPNAVKDMAQKDLELQKRQKDRTDADVKAEKARQGSAQRRDLCLVVRGHLKDMREGKPVFRYDASGARVILDEKERAAEMTKELDAEKKYCGESTT
jgi:hypothetical protein